MIAVIQRVASASVNVAERTLGSIGPGLVALVGAVGGDTEVDVEYIEKRLATLRIFADDDGRMNLSIADSGGALLVVSQFTLAADTRKGRRPSFVRALDPALAAPLIDDLVARLKRRGLDVQTGEFGANMQVELVNDGPVTLVLDSRETRRGNRRAVEDGVK
jgi:D-tyrosyl-tRNA(Tyr) deacylase